MRHPRLAIPDASAVTLQTPIAPSTRRTLGLVGYGAFGRFITPYLTPYFDVIVHDPRPRGTAAGSVRLGTLREAAECDVIVLAAPVLAIADIVRAIAPWVRPGTLVADVASVKVRPVATMRSLLPETVDVVGLHPLFGPQSGRHGIRGLPIAVCPVRPHDPRRAVRFLARRLGLSVSVVTPEEHDRAMAHVQALTHFVAAALARVGLPDTPLATPSYTQLRAAVEMVRFDAPAVYEAIQRENPYATEAREAFVRAVGELDVRR